jgi:hypothetical protein
MKSKIDKNIKQNDSLRKDILKSMIASFKIEGIYISPEKALASLKKVELNLEK